MSQYLADITRRRLFVGFGCTGIGCGVDPLSGFMQMIAGVIVEADSDKSAPISGSDSIRVEALLKSGLIFGKY